MPIWSRLSSPSPECPAWRSSTSRSVGLKNTQPAQERRRSRVLPSHDALPLIKPDPASCCGGRIGGRSRRTPGFCVSFLINVLIVSYCGNLHTSTTFVGCQLLAIRATLMAQRAAVSGAILSTAYCSAAGSPDAEFSLTGTTRNRRNSPMLSPVDVEASVLTPVDHYVGLIPAMIMVSGSGPCHSP